MSVQLHIANSKRKRKKIVKPVSLEDFRKNAVEGEDGQILDSEHLLISALIPPAVKAFLEAAKAEVMRLAGARYDRKTGKFSRYGSQRGSIVLGNQHVSIQRPRVRDTEENREVELETYTRFQDPSIFDRQVFHEGVKHVSQRDYEKGLPKIAASFGVSKSTVSRSWVNSTKKQIEIMQNRDLGTLGIVAVFIDGKRFQRLGVVIALGVGNDGKKHVLGLYQSSTENSAACLGLLSDLERRGLPEREILFVVDGGSGLNKALNEKYEIDDPSARRAVRVRCHFHKWQNLRDVLDEEGQKEAAPLFWAMRDAKDMIAARACSDALEACLKRLNASALASFLEAKDDLLMIHRLKLGTNLKKLFSTTNPIESLNSLLEEDLRRVKRWRNSEHFHRWLATACLHSEKRMRKVRGHAALPALVVALSALCIAKESVDSNTAVA
jgi:putative transposase